MKKTAISLFLGSLPFLINNKKGSNSRRRKRMKEKISEAQRQDSGFKFPTTNVESVKHDTEVLGYLDDGRVGKLISEFTEALLKENQEEIDDLISQMNDRYGEFDDFELLRNSIFEIAWKNVFSLSEVKRGDGTGTLIENPMSTSKHKTTLIVDSKLELIEEERIAQLQSLESMIANVPDGAWAISGLTLFNGERFRFLIKHGYIWKGADAIEHYKKFLPKTGTYRFPYKELHAYQERVNDFSKEEANAVADYLWSQMSEQEKRGI